MSINDAGQKIKLYFILLLSLVAISSFGLGRLSKTAQNDGQVSIIYPEGVQTASVGQSQPSTPERGSGAFVASNKGSKYYPTGCSAATSLKPENLIYFNTEAEAAAADYSRSSSCP